MKKSTSISWLLNLSGRKAWLHAGFCAAIVLITFILVSVYTSNMNTSEYRYGATSDYAIKVRAATIEGQTLQITLGISLFFLGCVYTGRWLCLRWFLKNKIRGFIRYGIECMIGWSIIGGLFMQYFFHPVNMHFFSFLLNISPFIILGLGAGVVIKMIRSAIRKQLEDAVAASAHKQSELNLLQSQLSPHFLFNTLNNMHSIAVLKHELIPGLLLKLSDLLRYSVYDTKQEFVPLADELAYIYNYIEFEKLRIGDRLVLKTDIAEISDQAIKIAPMLLIVFIENAFKHAKDTPDEKIYIDIALKLRGRELTFSVINSYSDGSEKEEEKDQREHSGLGLANAMKRLDLLYPDASSCQQSEEAGFYEVRLKLTIK